MKAGHSNRTTSSFTVEITRIEPKCIDGKSVSNGGLTDRRAINARILIECDASFQFFGRTL